MSQKKTLLALLYSVLYYMSVWTQARGPGDSCPHQFIFFATKLPCSQKVVPG